MKSALVWRNMHTIYLKIFGAFHRTVNVKPKRQLPIYPDRNFGVQSRCGYIMQYDCNIAHIWSKVQFFVQSTLMTPTIESISQRMAFSCAHKWTFSDNLPTDKYGQPVAQIASCLCFDLWAIIARKWCHLPGRVNLPWFLFVERKRFRDFQLEPKTKRWYLY